MLLFIIQCRKKDFITQLNLSTFTINVITHVATLSEYKFYEDGCVIVTLSILCTYNDVYYLINISYILWTAITCLFVNCERPSHYGNCQQEEWEVMGVDIGTLIMIMKLNEMHHR